MTTKDALQIALQKTKLNMEQIDDKLVEYTACNDGRYVRGNKDSFLKLSHIFTWTQSFFTGMAYWSFRITKDEEYLKWNNQFFNQFYSKVFDTPFETMHDLGFLYTPYAVAMYKATGDENMKKTGVKAADELAKRFDINGRYIRAWGRLDDNIPEYVDSELARDHFFTKSRGLAIIDCMMNLPLLYWASEATKNPFYKMIANAHADTTLKYFIREDNSVCHAYYFDPETGAPQKEASYCGYGVGSHWARGTSWAIYGFAIAYSYTGKKEYLDTAIAICKEFIRQCEEDNIPVWDFRLPKDTPAYYCGKNETTNWDVTDKENIKYNRDTSAAAVAICGIQEILRHTKDNELSDAKDKMFDSLINQYMDKSANIPGLLKCQNGNMTYTIFGDYFFMEALAGDCFGFDRLW